MSVAYSSRTPNISRGQVEKLYEFLGEHQAGYEPDGHIFHADGPSDDGSWWTFDVFASDEHFARYRDDRVGPGFQHVGISGLDYQRLDVFWDSSQMES